MEWQRLLFASVIFGSVSSISPPISAQEIVEINPVSRSKSNVRSTNWAVRALQALVNRYRCIDRDRAAALSTK